MTHTAYQAATAFTDSYFQNIAYMVVRKLVPEPQRSESRHHNLTQEAIEHQHSLSDPSPVAVWAE